MSGTVGDPDIAASLKLIEGSIEIMKRWDKEGGPTKLSESEKVFLNTIQSSYTVLKLSQQQELKEKQDRRQHLRDLADKHLNAQTNSSSAPSKEDQKVTRITEQAQQRIATSHETKMQMLSN